MSKHARIRLGHIGPAHGIRGEVVIVSTTAKPEDIAAYGPLTDERGNRRFKILSLRPAGKGLIASMEGITDRTAAETLRGIGLYVERSKLPPLPDGEHYQVDLVGCTADQADGQPIGEIIGFQNFGAGELLEIAIAGRPETVLVPFAEPFLVAVDATRRRVTLDIPDGLLD